MSSYSFAKHAIQIFLVTCVCALGVAAPVWSQVTHELEAPVQVSGDMVPFGDLQGYKISPDSRHVVYTANQDDKDVVELYVASIDGSDVRKLSGGSSLRNVASFGFEISPDSKTVLYVDVGINGVRLNVVNIDGSNPRALSLPLEDIEVVNSISLIQTPFSPAETSRVFFTAILANARRQLYSVNTDGTNLKQLSGLSGNQFDKEAGNIRISPDGLTAVYNAFDTGFSTTLKIFSIALDDDNASAVRIDNAGDDEPSFVPFISADSS